MNNQGTREAFFSGLVATYGGSLSEEVKNLMFVAYLQGRAEVISDCLAHIDEQRAQLLLESTYNDIQN